MVTPIADGAAQHHAEDAADRREDDGLDRNCTRISRRRAPSALRTPISRVRSVTEMVMMAITPMPPTISAIDEMTTSASMMARVKLFRMPMIESAVTMSKSFSWSRRQPVPAAHDLLDVRDEVLLREPSRGRMAIIWIIRSR